MKFFSLSKAENIATLTIKREKVNALNEPLIEQIHGCLKDLEHDSNIKSIILTGRGKFFSFGFDIPEFLSYSKEAFMGYLLKFTNLYTYMFLYPKPIIAVLNGYAIAGGCMISLACDFRIMVSGKAKISLNEITFGSSVFAGSVEMLKYCVGQKNAERILYSGTMYSAEEAHQLGLIDQISSQEKIREDARKAALDFASKDQDAFNSIKCLLRNSIADEMIKREKDSIHEFVEIWYSANTWKKLKKIKIYS